MSNMKPHSSGVSTITPLPELGVGSGVVGEGPKDMGKDLGEGQVGPLPPVVPKPPKRTNSVSSNNSVLPKVISDEFLTCKICFETFVKPKILDCLHTFCAQCLSDHVLRSQLQHDIPCPLCRQATAIPAEGVGALKDNFFIANLQDAMDLSSSVGRSAAKRICDSCKTRQEDKPSKMKCLDCDEFLCEECIHAHQRLNLTKNHKMVLIVVERQRSSEALMKNLVITKQNGDDEVKERHKCKDHRGEECKLYCEQCKVLICVTCKLTTHEGHKSCGFEKAAAQEKQNLAGLLHNVKTRITEYAKILEDWRQYSIELDKQKVTTQTKVDSRSKELHSLVDGWHYAITQQLEATYQEEKKYIGAKLDLVDVHMDTNLGVCDLAENILQHAKVRQFLALKDQIASDFGKLQRENINAMCLTQKSMLGFDPGAKALNFDHFGSFVLAHEKVLSSVRLRATQSLTFVRSFQTRTEVSGSRYDCSAIDVNPSDQILVTDRQTDKITLFRQDGERVLDVSVALMGKPISTVSTHKGELVFSRDKNSLCVFTAAGQHKQVIKDNMSRPCSAALSQDNFLYVLDYEQKTLYKFDAETYTKVSHIKLNYKKGSVWDKVAVNSQGNIYLSAFAENCLHEFTSLGEKLATYGRWGSTDAGDLYWQRGMCIDPHDNIIVADTNNSRIQMLNPQGCWTLLLTPNDNQIKSPTDVAVSSNGLLFALEKCGNVQVFEYLPY